MEIHRVFGVLVFNELGANENSVEIFINKNLTTFYDYAPFAINSFESLFTVCV